MKKGYLVVTHDIDSVNINFIEESAHSKKLLKKLNDIKYDDELVLEIFDEFNGKYPDMEAWAGETTRWPFNDYDILEVAVVYQF